jgi:hypothetical protein
MRLLALVVAAVVAGVLVGTVALLIAIQITPIMVCPPPCRPPGLCSLAACDADFGGQLILAVAVGLAASVLTVVLLRRRYR